MRTQDPNVLEQTLLRMMTGQRTPARQFDGIFDATIVDTDESNPGVNPPGQCRVMVPAVNGAHAMGPTPYPGVAPPPDDTACLVAFISPIPNAVAATMVRVICFYGWQAPDIGL